ncbi:MAG TPA: MFS transporter, partial [Hanamia sp.]
MSLKSDPFSSVRVVEYRNLLIGRFAFIMGLRMMATLIGWWIYLLTNDPFAIGLVGLSEVVPALSLALYAGHVIDQSEKRRLLLKGIVLYFLAAIALVFISGKFVSAHLSNHWIAVCIYLIIFCTGIFRAFTGPVFSAIIAYIVPRDDLQNATTWSQGTWLSASVTGHATGGFLIAIIGITSTLISTSFLIFLSFFFLVKLKPKPASVIKGVVRTW